MRYGLFSMPFHPLEKPREQAFREDHEACVFGDQLGFREVFIGEHVTDLYEQVSSSPAFLASLIYSTKNIKLATGTINLPNNHPAQIASTIAMLDHMSNGRMIMGISAGALASDWEIFGNLEKDRNDLFEECIDRIIELWTESPPYDFKGVNWSISTVKTANKELGLGELYKPLQKPHPPIGCSAITPKSPGLYKAAKRGWFPISSNFLPSNSLICHREQYERGCIDAKREIELSEWRVVRKIFVHEDHDFAKAYPHSKNSPYYSCMQHLLKKFRHYKKMEILKKQASQLDEDITTDSCLTDLVISGCPESVIDQIEALRGSIGNFGTILYAGLDWADPKLSRLSMDLFANRVMPKIR